MFKLDENLLIELGLGTLPANEKNRMLAHIYETLEMRVGMRLAEGMSDQQLNDFEQLMPLQTDSEDIKKQKEQAALRWLETNFPNYKQVVADELEKLKMEIKAAAPQIVAASSQQQTPLTTNQAMPPQQSPQQVYQPQPIPQQQPPQQHDSSSQAPPPTPTL